jgi:Ni,Fe-hydrogenase III large subunit
METVAGDTTIGHASAYCQAMESLSGMVVSERALHLRAIALELERLANHTGDLGALANDIGFLPTASYCGRLRGDYLNMSAELCGSRFGRNFLVPGGVQFDCSARQVNELTHRLQTIYGETMQAVDLLWKSTSIVTRFERTGILSHKMCQELGIVGLAARASGVKRDVRVDYPFGIYQTIPHSLSTHNGGDVYARAYVRYLEIQKSYSLIQRLLHDLPEGPIHHDIGPLKPNSLVLSMTEGWRGEICHIALTNEQGRFAAYKITDPSFHNWMGLAMALRDEQISNFPLCNKSFNLSYCGHDL